MVTQEEIINHIKAQHKNFTLHRSTGPTAYSAFNKAYWIDRMQQICLGKLSYEPIKNVEVFCIYNHFDSENEEQFRAWFDWILSPTESPWRDLVSQQPAQDRDFILHYGYYLTSLDFPANYVVNFLTAFRMAWEKPDMAWLWWELVKGGASRGAAYAVLPFVNRHLTDQNVKFGKRDTYKQHPFWSLYQSQIQGHQALSPNVADLSLAYRLNNGLPIKSHFSKHHFSTSTENLPVNIIWTGRGEDGSKDFEFSNALFDFLRRGGVNKKENVFKRSFANGEISHSPFGNNNARLGIDRANVKQLLDFCLYVDSLEAGKDFKIA